MKEEEDKLRLFGLAPEPSELSVPLAGSGVHAGFPSPAEDFLEGSLDLNKSLVRHPEATFFARVEGDSMKDDCVEDGDLLVIDKSTEPYDGCLAVAWVDGEFTLKRVKFEPEGLLLIPANPKYKPIRVTPDNQFMVWGVVRYVIKKV